MKWFWGTTRRGAGISRPRGAGDGTALEEEALEYSLDELREFLEADLADVRADPEFKEILRRKLWDLIQARNALRSRRWQQR